jgi:hypothetical protein
MIDAAIYSKLSGDTAVAAIVSTRIYPMRMPQGVVFPAISFDRVSTDTRDLTHNGTNQTAQGTFQFSCFAEDPKSAKQLGATVVKALHGWKGTVAGEKIFRSAVLNETDLFDEDMGIFQVAIDVAIMYRET